MANRHAYELYVPAVPLAEIYERGIAKWLGERGAVIRRGTPVAQVCAAESRVTGVQLHDGSHREFDFLVLATPWKALASLIPDACRSQLANVLDAAQTIRGSPITSLHLWFDRPLTLLRHAVLVGRLSQWVFARDAPADSQQHYYQVVISASRALEGRDREEVLSEVVADLATIFPLAKEAQLLRWRMLSQQDAVFSYRPGLDHIRPSQTTDIKNLFLAGDWTATGWPSTMESAVRSGFLAAEAILAQSPHDSSLLH